MCLAVEVGRFAENGFRAISDFLRPPVEGFSGLVIWKYRGSSTKQAVIVGPQKKAFNLQEVGKEIPLLSLFHRLFSGQPVGL